MNRRAATASAYSFASQQRRRQHAGHLGTELNNKAENVLQITKDRFDKNISSVTAMFIRDREFEPFAFRINEDRLPKLVEDYQPKAPRKETNL
jgi:hypothetical protein